VAIVNTFFKTKSFDFISVLAIITMSNTISIITAGLVYLPNEKLERAFEMISKVLYDSGFLFIVVKDGTGKFSKSSYKEIDGEDYDREFYLHSLEELKRYSLGKFNFYREIMPDDESSWKYYIFKRCDH